MTLVERFPTDLADKDIEHIHQLLKELGGKNPPPPRPPRKNRRGGPERPGRPILPIALLATTGLIIKLLLPNEETVVACFHNASNPEATICGDGEGNVYKPQDLAVLSNVKVTTLVYEDSLSEPSP